ncbi:FAD-dependent oxidoreductase [bacterium]|nr:FAD-dependent oxidoreductase [bacterium]
MKEKNHYDLIIVGAGPAGLMAAVYAARYRLKTLVLGKLIGGLISEAADIANFPTYEVITGRELTDKFQKQVEALGVEIKFAEVEEIVPQKKEFFLKASQGEFVARKVILAIGTERRKLGVKGEKELTGKGVSYCATCDAAFFKDKTVAVVGGGNAALSSALLLAKFARKVYIIYRREKFFRAEPAWIEQVESNPKIEPVFNAVIEEILGKDKVEGVRLNNGKELSLDGVFVEIGSSPNEELTQKLGLKTEDGYIVVDKKQRTNIPGIFAAGDITNNPLKQAITACAEGAVAATTAFEEIRQNQ